MSEIRSVSVHLDADVAGYIAKMKLAGAETDKAFSGSSRSISSTNHSLSTTAGELDKVDAGAKRVASSSRNMGNEIDRSRVKVDAGLKSIDKFSGRLGLLVSGLVAIGPAAVPITAVAIPAVVGLTADLGFLAAGAGTTVLAFHGVGTALTAFNKASLEPTATNIANAQAAMDKLPPSAQAFVLELHKLGPELTTLQQSAASGIFPGITAGLHSAVQNSPAAQRALHAVGLEVGQLAREAGDQIGGPKGKQFLSFVGHQAPQALDTLGHATGNVTDGLIHLVASFTPLTGDLNGGILRLSQDFDRWATSLGKTQDFESFVQYIQTNGPRVVSLLGDTAQLFGDIAAAAAPLGGPTLQALTLIVKAFDAIASSPLATPLLALAQLYSIMNLIGKASTGIGASFSGGNGFGARIASNAKTSVAGLLEVTSAADRARLSTTELAAAERERTVANRATLAKGALLGGGIALLSTGAADNLHATNTATFALAGSIAGPLGSAVGASVGLFSDWRSAVDESNASIHSLQQSANSFDLSGTSKQIEDLTKQRDSLSGLSGLGNLGNVADVDFHTLFGGQTNRDKQSEAINIATAQHAQSREALSALAGGFNTKPGSDGSGRDMTLNLQQLAQVATRAQPAMNALGISVSDLQAASAAGDGSLQHLVAQIVNWTDKSDSAAGKSQAVAKAFADMGDESLTASDRVDALTGSLDALVDPMLNLGAAHDAFRQALNDLPQALSKTSKTLRGNSDAALQNRAAIRGLVSNVKDQVEAQANAGASSQRMAATLKAGRSAIIAQGQAAGLNKQQIQQMINTMHLTPKLIRTLFQSNADAVAGQVNGLRSALEGLNGRVFHATISVTRVGTSDITATGGHVIRAEGGTVPGQRHPYGDRTLVLAAPGEEIITNRNGEADRFRADRSSGRIPAYAAGGTVQTHNTNGPAGNHATDGVRNELHRLQTGLHAATAELDKERSARQALVQQQQQLVSTVQDNFRSDIFGDGGIWSGMSNPFAILKGEIRSGQKYDRLVGRAHRRGLTGGALGEVDTLAEAEQVNSYTPAQLKRLSALYRRNEQVSHAAGLALSHDRFGSAIDKQTKVVRAQAKDVHQLTQQQKETNHRLAAIEKAQHQAAKDMGKELSGTGSKAIRTQRRTGG